MRFYRGNRDQTPDADGELLNLTPLIDVVFVVLIMFIIIAPLLELDRIHLSNGATVKTKETLPVKDQALITIHVYSDNTIFLNNLQVTQKELIVRLKELKQAHPFHIPQLFHDKTAYFGTYQIVKNAVESSGFEQLDVVLKPG